MEKQERFVVIAKSRLYGEKIEEIAVKAFTTYPTDDELQTVWQTCSENRIVYWLKVEKQVRFE